MKTNSAAMGLLFGFAALMAIGGPMLYNHAGEKPYAVPEPTILDDADMRAVEAKVKAFCEGGAYQKAEPTWPEPPPKQEVPVLLYHRITKADKPSHEVTRPALYEAQLNWLKAEGYETISVAQLEAYMSGKGTIPPKPIVLTFDDGWKDNVEAAKYLKKLDFGATFYVVSGFFNAPQYFSQDDLEGLAKNPKFEIGSHSHSHFVKHADMAKVDLCTFAKELAASKLILERIIEKPVTSFAWPYGYTTKESIYAAQAIGYTNTTHVSRDSHNAPGHSPLYIRRMNVDGGCSLEDFKTMVETRVLKECTPRGAHQH